MTKTIELPKEFHPQDDYSSHRPVLYMALEATRGIVCEFGCGHGSTPVLQKYCKDHERGFWSYDNDPDWAKKFENVQVINDWKDLLALPPFYTDLLFIDCKPGEVRKDLLIHFADYAEIIVVHDTEPGAEYVYHLASTLDGFIYRFDEVARPGMPGTAAVSNTYDFTHWKNNDL